MNHTEYMRGWREAHREEVRAIDARYRAAHREELLARRRERERGTRHHEKLPCPTCSGVRDYRASQCINCLGRSPASIAERVARHTDRGDGTGCWLWTASRNEHGYGNGGGHRLAWIAANGPIPEGMHVLHHCDNPPCVRPDHLFLGTHADNMADMVRKGRHRTARRLTWNGR